MNLSENGLDEFPEHVRNALRVVQEHFDLRLSDILATTRQEEGSEEWRDISTCPKDGSHFLALQVVVADEYDEDDRLILKAVREEFTVVAYWAFGSVVQYPWNGGMPSNVSYILWRPLPSPPQEPRHD